MASTINILASNCFFDASLAPLYNGTLTVTPSSMFRAGGGGQAVSGTVVRRIYKGSITEPLALADPSQTSPQGIGYTFVVTGECGSSATYANVLISPDGSGNFDLSQLNTGQWVTAVPQTVISVTGASTASTLTFTTGAAAISAYTAVAIMGGLAVTASSSNLAHMGNVVGIATAGAQPGAPVMVQASGSIAYNGWSFTGGAVGLSANGVPSQSVPSSGFLQVLGNATSASATSFLIALQSPIQIQ